MKVLFLTNEYPPNTYGGAGVHVEYLSRELSKFLSVDVRCFGDQAVEGDALSVKGYGLDTGSMQCPDSLKSVFGAVQRGLSFNTFGTDADVVHCHTWYTHMGGILAKLNYGIPLIVTTHSLEPMRPWKREQLGGGYDFSCWVEKMAIEMADRIISVSEEAKADVLKYFNVEEERIRVIHNGIDTSEYKKVDTKEVFQKYKIDLNKPYLLFVGRITRQKGIIYLVEAVKHMNPDIQFVLCAGSPDTPEISAELKAAVNSVRTDENQIVWIDGALSREECIEIYSHASVFCCPSIYEPFGIINLEAMACETPVVGSATGGIPEIIVDGETGTLIPLDQKKESPFTPIKPEQFSKDIANAVNYLMNNPDVRDRYAIAGRKRVEEYFSWASIAEQTYNLYRETVESAGKPFAVCEQ